MSHVTYEWSHVTCEWRYFKSTGSTHVDLNESCHERISHARVDLNKSCHIRISHVRIRHISLKMISPRNPWNPETQIPRYKFKLKQKINLNLYCRDTEKFEFLNLVDFWCAAISVETVIDLNVKCYEWVKSYHAWMMLFQIYRTHSYRFEWVMSRTNKSRTSGFEWVMSRTNEVISHVNDVISNLQDVLM